MFVHGYCGSGSLFHKIFEKLAENVCLIMVDLVGMGGSDHPRDFDRTTSDLPAVIDYFVDYLELWRKSMGKNKIVRKHPCFNGITNLTDFYFAGHSFGAYVCGHYALKHP